MKQARTRDARDEVMIRAALAQAAITISQHRDVEAASTPALDTRLHLRSRNPGIQIVAGRLTVQPLHRHMKGSSVKPAAKSVKLGGGVGRWIALSR